MEPGWRSRTGNAGADVRVGVTLARLRPEQFDPMTRLADELGYESIWLSEHLVIPREVQGELRPGEAHAPIAADVPVFDALAYLSYLAGRTTQIRLGTFVYLLALRHPFVGARGFATLDVVSNGRAIAGVGAGWLTTEWEAAGLPTAGRGRRLDEAIDVCRRLWTEETVAHEGGCWRFGPVGFAPKPLQPGGPPVLVGGESVAAMRRAILRGDGWIAMDHDLDGASDLVARFREVERELGRDPGSTPVTMGADVRTPDDLASWEELGLDRVIVAPWRRTADAESGLRALAAPWSA